jgi:hypothetical protein
LTAVFFVIEFLGIKSFIMPFLKLNRMDITIICGGGDYLQRFVQFALMVGADFRNDIA